MNTSTKQTENLTQCGNKSKPLLVTVKSAYYQYKSDLKYVKNVSGIWYGKPYRGLITKISIAWHDFYWHVLKR
jgi:hypothetical protein